MKKLNLLFVTLVLVLTSCSSDDSTLGVSGDIVGRWEMVDYTYSGTTVTNAQGQTISADFIGEAFDMNNIITFLENPNNIESEGSFNLKVTTTVAGQTTTQNVRALKAVNGGTWEIVNGELITNANNQTGKMKIEVLSDTSLVLSTIEEKDLSQSGISIITKINAKIFLERQ